MEVLIGRLEREGEVALGDLQIHLVVDHEPSGLISWWGSFETLLSQHPQPGESYHLVLEDGRSGTILIKSVSIGPGTVPVDFVGSGPLE